MKRQKSNVWFISWYKYCQAYLHHARIGLLELKNESYRLRFNLFDQGGIYDDKIILLPIIWSIKHAIELLLKALDVRITEEYLKSHDNADLQKSIEGAFHKLGVTDSDALSELLDLSNKYLRLEFWKGSLVTKCKVTDKDNDLFRYPENKLGFEVDMIKVRGATPTNLQELGDDVDRLTTLLYKLHEEITKGKIRRP